MAKIFLDDKRPAPDKSHGYNCVRDYASCKILVDAFRDDIEVISLDYYLGVESVYTGLDVLDYMVEQGIAPKHINIHSTHTTGRERMREYAQAHFPHSDITTNTY